MSGVQAVEQSPFRHEDQELHVTMSFGVAEVRGDEDGAALIARADHALYPPRRATQLRVSARR